MRTVFLTEMALPNLGCEAIVRSTISIIRNAVHGPVRFVMPSFSLQQDQQRMADIEELVIFPISQVRYQFARAVRKLRLPDRLIPRRHSYPIAPDRLSAVLSLGGDIYCGNRYLPVELLKVEKECRATGVPFIIWGATLGDGVVNAKYQATLHEHFSRAHLITARDSATVSFLAEHDIRANVRRVFDPAFVMEPLEFDIEPFLPKKRTPLIIGINLSPFSQRYFPHLDLVRETARGVESIIEQTGQSVVLVAHVFLAPRYMNDVRFQREILATIQPKYRDRVGVADQDVGTRRLKYLISQLHAYAGTRMHSTIAAFSTEVPTLSLPYSKKGFALPLDVYGNTEWLLPIREFSGPRLAQKMIHLLDKRSELQESLRQRLPRMKESAWAGGAYLCESLGIATQERAGALRMRGRARTGSRTDAGRCHVNG